MYNCIKSFADNDRENGLLLLDMPTGFGKTYSVIQFIIDFMKDDSNVGKRVFFITTLKKNLPIDDLQKRLQEEGLGHLFQERVIKLESNVDTAIRCYSSDLLREIPAEIKQSDEFKKFKADVEFLKNSPKNQNPDFISSVRNSFRENSERIFRAYIQNLLFRRFPTVEARLLAIKTDSAWQWLGKLYPSVFTREKQILFMSVDKFICPHSTIVEKNYNFYTSTITNNALIFIDEFDATKETILTKIIENGLNEKIDYIELFNHIYAVLQNKTFPERFFAPSEQRRNSEYNKQSLKDVMKKLKDKADAIFSTYSLQFNHKTDNNEQESSNFLFQDHKYISILNGKNKFISTYSDKKDNINRITFSENKAADKNSIQKLLGKLRGFVSWFQTTVYIFAVNYYQARRERAKDGEEEYTLESAIRSVLTEFNLGSTYENYLFSQIMMKKSKSKKNVAGSEFDLSLYENGFRYFAFENSPDYEFKSIISMVSFTQTPERILTKLCEKAKVIGVSATATLPSLLSNYDLYYFSLKMGEAYSHISKADYLRLKSEFDNAQHGYKNINIHSELFDSSNYSVALWNTIFDNDELSNVAHTNIERSLPDEYRQSTFYYERYYKIVFAFKKFVEHKDIRSFLCMLNKIPKTYDRLLNVDVLYDLFGLVLGTKAVSDVKRMVFILEGNGFDEKKDQLVERLSKGEKLFVISAYQTIGAGQNIQYDIPADLYGTLIKTNDRPCSKQKDFDAIYLDNPTHLSVNMNTEADVPPEAFVKYLFQTEYLQENGEISADLAKLNIKKAFRKSFSSPQIKIKGYKDTHSVCLFCTKQIVQAIGRMCRTNMKQPNIYVFADATICDCFQVGIAEDRLINREVAALIEEIKKKGAAEIPSPSLVSRSELCSERSYRYISNMLYEDWDEKRMENWEQLRLMVLEKPTASIEKVYSDFRLSQFYIQMDKPSDRYFYFQEEDYNRTGISFTRSKEYPYEVSSTAAKLERILMFPGMKEYFTAKHWAMSFVPKEFIMSPAIFNNIYKGALGEAAGWVWFRNVLNIALDLIKEPDLFELFDFKVPNLPIYVDFKNWHETTLFDEKEMLDKAIRKAKECKAECVIIANILADSSYTTMVTHYDGITFVRCPSLMTDNVSSVDANIEAAKTIRRCISEISNTNE